MLLAVFAPLLVVCQVSASTLCVSSMPSNVEAGLLQPDVIELLQRSATFRHQCARIAATRVLRVSVHIGALTDKSARAQTTINRYEAGGIRADVTLRFSEDYLELLAHEFEHILEQVDGIKLRDEVAAGRAWETPSGAFETRRASDAGIRVRQEYEAVSMDAVQPDAAKVSARRQHYD
jgi:hypothetical protein